MSIHKQNSSIRLLLDLMVKWNNDPGEIEKMNPNSGKAAFHKIVTRFYSGYSLLMR